MYAVANAAMRTGCGVVGARRGFIVWNVIASVVFVCLGVCCVCTRLFVFVKGRLAGDTLLARNFDVYVVLVLVWFESRDRFYSIDLEGLKVQRLDIPAYQSPAFIAIIATDSPRSTGFRRLHCLLF